MNDAFDFSTAQQRVTSERPRIDARARKEQRLKICSALDEARAHKERLMLPLAKQRQDDTIKFWIEQLRLFDAKDDAWLT